MSAWSLNLKTSSSNCFDSFDVFFPRFSSNGFVDVLTLDLPTSSFLVFLTPQPVSLSRMLFNAVWDFAQSRMVRVSEPLRSGCVPPDFRNLQHGTVLDSSRF